MYRYVRPSPSAPRRSARSRSAPPAPSTAPCAAPAPRRIAGPHASASARRSAARCETPSRRASRAGLSSSGSSSTPSVSFATACAPPPARLGVALVGRLALQPEQVRQQRLRLLLVAERALEVLRQLEFRAHREAERLGERAVELRERRHLPRATELGEELGRRWIEVLGRLRARGHAGSRARDASDGCDSGGTAVGARRTFGCRAQAPESSRRVCLPRSRTQHPRRHLLRPGPLPRGTSERSDLSRVEWHLKALVTTPRDFCQKLRHPAAMLARRQAAVQMLLLCVGRAGTTRFSARSATSAGPPRSGSPGEGGPGRGQSVFRPREGIRRPDRLPVSRWRCCLTRRNTA